MSQGAFLNALAAHAHETAKEKGFWDHAEIEVSGDDDQVLDQSVENPSIYAEKIALIHSEASEVLEARRDGDEEKEKEEVADVIIRCLDYAAARGFNIHGAVMVKMTANRARPRLHGRGNG